MDKKAMLLINSEGLPFGFSASANKIRFMAHIFAQSDIDVYCLNKRKAESERKAGYDKGIRFAFFNKTIKSKNIFQSLKNIFYAHIREFIFVKRKSKSYQKKYILIQYDWFPIFFYYWIFSKVFNLKIIVNIMEWHMAVPSNNLFEKINKYLFDTLSFKMASGAIPISKFIQKKIYSTNKYLPTFLLPAITDFELINTIETSDHSSKDYILYCGNLGYMSVIKFIIESYSRIKIRNRYVKLLLVVNGKREDFIYLKNLINKFKVGADVIIKNDLTFQSLISSYKNSLGLLIPLRNTNQDMARFPHKISEYTATKRPIVTMDYGVINDYFDKTNAYICYKYSTHDYAKIIDSMIENPDEANAKGVEGYELGLKFLNTCSYKKTLPQFLLKI